MDKTRDGCVRLHVYEFRKLSKERSTLKSSRHFNNILSRRKIIL